MTIEFKAWPKIPIIEAATIEEAKTKLINSGSLAATGFMDVEGIVMYNYLSRSLYKIIINK